MFFFFKKNIKIKNTKMKIIIIIIIKIIIIIIIIILNYKLVSKVFYWIKDVKRNSIKAKFCDKNK